MSKVIYKPKGLAGEYSGYAINLYNKCSNACDYCLTGDTLLFRSDMSVVMIRDVKVEDKILGIVSLAKGKHNRKYYSITEVTNKMVTREHVYEVTLDNGLSCKCSENHRWLTEREWKYTMPARTGMRPFLTTNNKVSIASSQINLSLDETDDYRRGYLSGMIRGDGHLCKHSNLISRFRPDRNNATYTFMQHAYQFNLRLKDIEAIDRTAKYLLHFGVVVKRFKFTDTMYGIRTSNEKNYNEIKALIEWNNSKEWLRGFLSGIFDAEGGFTYNIMRIYNSDDIIINTVILALDMYGIPHIMDKPRYGKNKIVKTVRITGGEYQQTKFIQIMDPAITRKRTLGKRRNVGSSKVKSIKDLGYEEEMFDITTTSETFFANGMVSHNCYVPAIMRYKREDFNNNPVVRKDILEKLGKQLANERGDFDGVSDDESRVLMCFTCDPYQGNEEFNHITTEAIELLNEADRPFSILTKNGKRASRDFHLYRKCDHFGSTLTFCNYNDSMRHEPDADPPMERIEAIKLAHGFGIYTWVSMEPVIDPGQSLRLIQATMKYVDKYMIGKINYQHSDVDWKKFVRDVEFLFRDCTEKLVLKSSLLKYKE